MKKVFTAVYILLSALVSACNYAHNLTPEDVDKPGATAPDTPASAGRVPLTVLSYDPAPGQFVNEMPQYTDGATAAQMTQRAQQYLDKGWMVSLGAWGGSITLRLDRPIEVSADGSAEMRVEGNAFINGQVDGQWYGAAEPGIIEVMTDTNHNGLPDDGPWCLVPPGAETKKVTVTYTRHNPADNDLRFIHWQCSDGTEGYLTRFATIHSHEFFGAWLPASQTTFTVTGLRLPDNGRPDTVPGQFRLFAYDNTADSYPASMAQSGIRLSTAQLPDGTPARMQRVHFVRITTGVLQCNGALGEVSTEVGGITRL